MAQTMASQVPQLTQQYIQQGMAPDAAAARVQGEAAQMGAQLAAQKIEDTFYDSEKGMYMTAQSDTTTTHTTEDGYKHKATPAVYGMFGLVYKPLDKLTISAYGNLIGERTTTLKFGNVTLPTRFTLNLKAGYKPTEKVEVFLNARNLLNTKEQEFVYCDEIGGIYTIGLNFAL
jgi:outer membrane receptor protein involved in Fe transport